MKLLLLFIFGFICWIVWMIVRTVLSAFMFVRRTRRQVNDAFGFGEATGSKQPNRKSPRHQGKRINPNVGEYVEFEDLPPLYQTSGQDSTKVRYTVEEQISDVEWEDIK